MPDSAYIKRLIAQAAEGDERAREKVRSAGLVTVTRMATSTGETRSLPVEVEQAGPPRTAAGRSVRRRAAAHPSPVRPVVAFSRWAFESMRSENGDADETGGFLIGSRSAGTIRIVEATGPGWDANRSRRYVGLLWAHGEQILDNLRCRGRDVEIVGTWHTHEDGGSPSPSVGDLDLNRIGSALDRIRSDVWLDVIGAFKDERSLYMDWAAWQSYRDRDGRIRCISLPLKIGESWR
jgi:JAB domain-containing protein similar to deubiquitination enzymes